MTGREAYESARRETESRRENPFKGWKKLKPVWHRIYRAESWHAAQAPELGLDMRLWFLAVSRAGFNGHANFGADELVKHLAKYTNSTGEVGRYGKRQFQKVIEKGISANLYGPGSNMRCIIVASHLIDVDRPPGNWTGCREHGHRWRWFRDTWAQIDGEGDMGWVNEDGTVHYPGKTN